LDSGDILVTGPNGYSSPASFVAADPSANAQAITASYLVVSQRASWGPSDNGTYHIMLKADQVRDAAGTAAPAAELGTFEVAVAGSEPLSISGTPAPDRILLSQANGLLTVSLNDQIHTYAITSISSLSVLGMAGDDLIQLDAGVMPASVKGGQGNDTVLGSAGDDTLRGGLGHDRLVGGAGSDLIYGGRGMDTLRAGGGNDQLFGGAGNDQLSGGGGNDTLNDTSGNDTLVGGRGDDRFLSRDLNADLLDGGAGSDFAEVDLISTSAPDQLLNMEQVA
jgi:hypothetical protein